MPPVSTLFPFAACLVGFGYHRFVDRRPPLAQRKGRSHRFDGSDCPSFPLRLCHDSAFYLAYYNEIARGNPWRVEPGHGDPFLVRCPDAAIFWTQSIESFRKGKPSNRRVCPSRSIRITASADGCGRKSPIPADYYLVQSRQGMWRREEASLFFRQKPVASVELQGIQLLASYSARASVIPGHRSVKGILITKQIISCILYTL
jgi:hypothetical protein